MTEDEILEILAGFMPETLEGWLAAVVAACLVLSLIVPPPPENAHPALKMAHRLMRILGMGAGRLKNAGKIGKIFRRR